MALEGRRRAVEWLKKSIEGIYHNDGLKGVAVVVGLLVVVIGVAVGVMVVLDIDVSGVLRLIGG